MCIRDSFIVFGPSIISFFRSHKNLSVSIFYISSYGFWFSIRLRHLKYLFLPFCHISRYFSCHSLRLHLFCPPLYSLCLIPCLYIFLSLIHISEPTRLLSIS